MCFVNKPAVSKVGTHSNWFPTHFKSGIEIQEQIQIAFYSPRLEAVCSLSLLQLHFATLWIVLNLMLLILDIDPMLLLLLHCQCLLIFCNCICCSDNGHWKQILIAFYSSRQGLLQKVHFYQLCNVKWHWLLIHDHCYCYSLTITSYWSVVIVEIQLRTKTTSSQQITLAKH